MYTMLQVCEDTGLTYQTLKYYCNEGLVPNVKRDANNRRIFDEHDLRWVRDLACLKKCDMSIKEMKAYLALCLQGERTIPERKAMLDGKRASLCREIEMLNRSIACIDMKQGFYDDVLAGRTEYVSNLVPKAVDGDGVVASLEVRQEAQA